jgi:nitric oxide reductase subunit B
MTYAFPQLRNRAPYNQLLNMISFWVISSGVVFMTVTLTFAGVLQTHLERVMGMSYMDAQDQIGLFYVMRFGAGAVTVIGVLLFIYSLLVPQKQSEIVSEAAGAPAE